MFNIKATNFLSFLRSNKTEQKYLKKLINKLNIDSEEKDILLSFLKISTFKELKEFLDSQEIITYTISTEDFEKDLNSIKEKIAYKLNEYLLNKYN